MNTNASLGTVNFDNVVKQNIIIVFIELFLHEYDTRLLIMRLHFPYFEGKTVYCINCNISVICPFVMNLRFSYMRYVSYA